MLDIDVIRRHYPFLIPQEELKLFHGGNIKKPWYADSYEYISSFGRWGEKAKPAGDDLVF